MQAIWITPIKALAKEIKYSAERAIEGLGMEWRVGIRSGDTSTKERKTQKIKPPEILITTPESIHILMASRGYRELFGQLKAVIADEWHELIGSKRGVQVELALSRFRGLNPALKTWGISATIGNLEEAMEVLLGPEAIAKAHFIRSKVKKKIKVDAILPKEIEKFPWAGHLGLSMLEEVIPVVRQSTSSLIFTNVRSQCEYWYQAILRIAPDLAGAIAMHHGSISKEIRDWVEQALHEGRLKAVVCTSSLDLGVDFRPVETVIQIGSPKGVARFMQRAGRSGHQPGATSKIHFVPTHALELLECAALRTAIQEGIIEDRIPYARSFDVLIQYMVTLALSEGFIPEHLYEEVKKTFSYQSMSPEEWAWACDFITRGGALNAYDEFHKVKIFPGGLYKVDDRRIAMKHRLSIGTIVGDTAMEIKYMSGKRIGTVEEYFISQLNVGDTFWFAGRSLELLRISGLTAYVRKSKSKKGKIPSWQGGRVPLSSQLTEALRMKIDAYLQGNYKDPELKNLVPLLDLQQERSALPAKDEFLIEYFHSTEGHHLLMYPFEGRFVHEGMATLIAYRISKIQAITFSYAMNDYGFELLSDGPIPIVEAMEKGLFTVDDLSEDIHSSINMIEMANRRFKEIGHIAGLVFRGYPGKEKKDRHLNANTSLLFKVFHEYDPENMLYVQAFDEALNFQLEEGRLRQAFDRIAGQHMVFTTPHKATPFAFPIMVDRMREKLTSENLKNRIQKMTLDLE